MLPRDLRAFFEMGGHNQVVLFANGGPKGGVTAMFPSGYESMASEYRSENPLDPKSRVFARAIDSTAKRVKIDGNGRLLIPPELRRLLGLERELYLFTAGAWFEIWDKARWESQAYMEASDVWENLYGFDSLQTPAASTSLDGGVE